MTGAEPGDGGLVVGVGARPGVTAAEILGLVEAALHDLAAPMSAVRRMATVEARRDEPGVVAAARHHGWPLVGHPAALLAGVDVPHPGAAAHAALGTPSVAEAACLIPLAVPLSLGTAMPQPVLLVPKRAGRRVTVAIARHGAPDRGSGASA
ncbi:MULTISPECIES: cobalamin biosynthesis protein [unclassified Frankia]